jgi:hypothetical protein
MATRSPRDGGPLASGMAWTVTRTFEFRANLTGPIGPSYHGANGNWNERYTLWKRPPEL